MTKQLTGPLESEIQREICDWLHVRGYFFWRQNNVPIFGVSNDGKKRFRALPKYTPKGIPDILVIVGGKLIGFEVKRAGAPLRPEQAVFGSHMIKNGAYWHVVYNVTDVSNVLLHG